MKVGILTWHKALNHGAVLQAYALQNVIVSMSGDVEILDYIRQVTDIRSRREKVLAKIKKIHFRYILNQKNVIRMNKEKQQKFNEFTKENLNCAGLCTEETCDAVVVGSDMVFNLRQGYSPYMFGKGLNAKRVLSYAACAGGSTLDDANMLGVADEIKAGLFEFSGIGCRDESTKQFVKDLSSRTDCINTIDPVLLYGFEKEKKKWAVKGWDKHKPFLLIYAYHGFMDNPQEVNQIKKIAKSHNLVTVACGYYHPWCDEIVNADPREFLEMFVNASYIVTDTFHGTVFSLINNKPFCSIVRKNGFKLRYLLEQSGMDKHIADNSEGIEQAFSIKNDYGGFNMWLEKERSISMDFLRKQIG